MHVIYILYIYIFYKIKIKFKKIQNIQGAVAMAGRMGWLWELSRFLKSDGWCLRAGKGTAAAWWHQGEFPGGRVDAPSMRRRKNNISQELGGMASPTSPSCSWGRRAPAPAGRAWGATGTWWQQGVGRLDVLQCPVASTTEMSPRTP